MAHAAHPIGNMSPCPTPALETKYTAAAIPKPKPIPVSTGSATGKPMERFSQQHLFVRDLPEGQETDPFDDQAIRKVRDILKHALFLSGRIAFWKNSVLAGCAKFTALSNELRFAAKSR